MCQLAMTISPCILAWVTGFAAAGGAIVAWAAGTAVGGAAAAVVGAAAAAVVGAAAAAGAAAGAGAAGLAGAGAGVAVGAAAGEQAWITGAITIAVAIVAITRRRLNFVENMPTLPLFLAGCRSAFLRTQRATILSSDEP